MKKLSLKEARKISTKASASVLATGTMVLTKLTSFAGITVKNPGDPTAKMGDIVELMINIVMYAGVAVAAFGVFELGLSLFVEGQADKKPKAIIAIVAGAIMCAVKWFLSSVIGVI